MWCKSSLNVSAAAHLLRSFAKTSVWLFPDEEEEHPAVEDGESVTHYQTRTETYWTKLARANMGPDAKDKKVAKVALAMAKVFYEDR